MFVAGGGSDQFLPGFHLRSDGRARSRVLDDSVPSDSTREISGKTAACWDSGACSWRGLEVYRRLVNPFDGTAAFEREALEIVENVQIPNEIAAPSQP
jgi:hypothetical protein